MQTYYRWRKESGDLKLDQAKQMKELVRENAKLKRLVAELSDEGARCTLGNRAPVKPNRLACASLTIQ
jgi:cell division protein FtsB